MREQFRQVALDRATRAAEDWLSGDQDEEGFPRSWDECARQETSAGYEIYDRDFEAPAIAGYEALELAGRVLRVGVFLHMGQERVHFRKTDTF